MMISFSGRTIMEITDEYMKQMIIITKEYTIVILKATQGRKELEDEKIIWEHGKRNFSLEKKGSCQSPVPLTTGLK
jgi:hypothetical protein